MSAVFPEKGVHRTTAIFQARSGERTFLVRHDALPALGMGGMELMAFEVESRTLLDAAGLAAGDRVRLTVRQSADRLVVVKLDRVR